MNYLKARTSYIIIIFGMVFLIIILRLFSLQIVSEEYTVSAKKNAIKNLVLIPSRGIIYDRNGKIYVMNYPIYDLTITPSDLYIPDTSVLEQALGIDRETIRKKIQKAEEYSKIRSSIFVKQIDREQFTAIQEKLLFTRGIESVVRNTRYYKFPYGANFLGYISEVNQKDIDESLHYYDIGDLHGSAGIEKSYEQYLRGKKGKKIILKDVWGRDVGRYHGGKYDENPAKGSDITIGIDLDLQAFGESLMQNKKGSIVAIEPKSGEILAFVSAPSYDPNLLAGSVMGENYLKLEKDPLKPLYNRPLMGVYPPGSTFKLLNALIALQEGVITPNTAYPCAGGFIRNKGKPGCHGHPSPLLLEGSIQHSCNAYYASVFVDFLHNKKFPSITAAYKKWRWYMNQFGCGVKLGVDLPGEKTGLIPTAEYFNSKYDRWNAYTILSMSIGQGEVQLTPLQMANFAAIIANRGWFITPHFVKKVHSTSNLDKPFKKNIVPVEKKHFDVVVNGMEKVVLGGTARSAYLPDVAICGKTGTVENSGENHSIFVAFAPKDDPKIAIAVVMENSGGAGGTWAAPAASLMIEKYLKGKISDEAKLNYIKNANFIHKNLVVVPKKPQNNEQKEN